MNGADVVYHFAAETGVGQSQVEIARYVSTNTHGTAVVLEAAIAAKVQHLILASSRAIYGEGQYRCLLCETRFVAKGRTSSNLDIGLWDIYCPACGAPSNALPMTEEASPAPTSIYGVTKLQQEELTHSVARTHNLPATLLRFFNVFGPGQSLRNPYTGILGTFFRRALSGSVAEVYEDGQMLRDFVFVRDAVDVLESCAGNDRAFGQTLNVGTGRAVTVLGAAKDVFEALSIEPRISITGYYRLGDIRHSLADTIKLESVLGFRPQTPFKDGLQEYVEWALGNVSDADDVLEEHHLAGQCLAKPGVR